MDSIYLDNAATTKPLPQVVEAMNRTMADGFGNPSSLYGPGLKAAEAVRDAMETIEMVVGGGPWNVVFTSGGSESDTMAVIGTVPRGKRNRVITTTLEHAAIDESCKRVVGLGGEVVAVSGGTRGVVDPREIEDAVDDVTGLVSITHLASELGTVQPVAEISRLVREKSRKCLFHTDAVQALAQLPRLDLGPEIDMVSISAHKIHGPMGMGALLLRPNVKPRSIICGGDQQGGLRPGTLNVPGIVGFQTATRILAERRIQAASQMRSLTDNLVQGIVGGIDGVRTLGDSSARAPGMVVLAVSDVRSEVLLHAAEARGVLASAGSACHSTRTEPPKCITDAGLKQNEGVLRLSLSFETTNKEIDHATATIVDAISSIRDGKAAK